MKKLPPIPEDLGYFALPAALDAGAPPVYYDKDDMEDYARLAIDSALKGLQVRAAMQELLAGGALDDDVGECVG